MGGGGKRWSGPLGPVGSRGKPRTIEAMSNDAIDAVRTLVKRLEPLHSAGYFAPEVRQALEAVGLRGGRMCYFAARSAAMGAVSAATVRATFYNFQSSVIDRAIPAAWEYASPERVIEGRYAGVAAMLERLLPAELREGDAVPRASELLHEVVAFARPDGRPLFAAHAALPIPEEPLLALWHGVTAIREFRGDTHIAALVSAGIPGIDAVVLHNAAGTGFTKSAAMNSRGYTEEQWEGRVAALKVGGLIAENGDLTEGGVALRSEIEDLTDFASIEPWGAIGEEGVAELSALTAPLTKAVARSGVFPDGTFGKG